MIPISDVVARWDGPDRPLLRGELIDANGFKCAQGDILAHWCGWTDTQLRDADQADADKAVAQALGISVLHAVLLSTINDKKSGAPSVVLTHPELLIGPEAPLVLAFWKRLDEKPNAVWIGHRGAFFDSSFIVTRALKSAEPFDAAREAMQMVKKEIEGIQAFDAAEVATLEIQGRKHLTSFYFLPLFGIARPEELLS